MARDEEDRRTLERANRELHARRRKLEASGRGRVQHISGRRPDPRDKPDELVELTAEQEARVEELTEQNIAAVLDRGGVDNDMTRMAARAWAVCQLDEEERPEYYAKIKEREAEEERRAWIRWMECTAKMPAWVVEAIRTGYNDQDQPLTTTGPDKWLHVQMRNDACLVVLAGLVGTGKTLTACRWAAHARKRQDVRYIKAHQVCSLSDRAWKDRPVLRRLASCAVLIIDEVGTSKETAEGSAALETLMHDRFEDRLITIVCANLTEEEFAARYKDRIMSRVYERGGILPCTEIMREGERRRQAALARKRAKEAN